ncbi:conserved hypothetical protein [Afipia carboxidovorans OM5]|uniref:Uncharacterized protein n=1 Tax=Afipia carboxidovorans (strain ATCC 49405 / DSM 1227 / KCTC 32145 / OM5) TaxID=504832 RepID=B6JBJ7_AFIC5|nr:hypothetical protein [Afipia carboxidovorans]ACI92538.1 conserved hypothetical protein [Afipia carboxidovorans OM5]AEI03691.1 hypothetical protein OCA4_c25720 [Afipia carboxidovorans OM4]AEI07268.1 hypothetical protein OCA5_c25730 [Afipia carboxidovorans OM5]BEV44648.1 hypothetical protein CRBSH125_08310 [Afipia carboxidovorans]
MRIITPVVYAGLLAVSIYAALAQTSPIQYTASVPDQAPTKLAYAAPNDGTTRATKPAVRVGKREACRQKIASNKQLRPREARDRMQLCVAEARVDCLRQAIDRHVLPSQRRLYVKSCVAS